MYARRVRRAHVARRPPRTAPSISTERRPKRRRETRTTTGDGMREEDEERTTAARYVPAEVQRLESPTHAPRGAGARARACLLAQRDRRGAARRQREEFARLLRLQRGARRARINEEGWNDSSAVNATRGSFDRSKTKRGRARCSTRALERQQTIAWARPGTLCGGVRRGFCGFEGDHGGVWAPSWPVEGLRTCFRLPSPRSRSGERRPRCLR